MSRTTNLFVQVTEVKAFRHVDIVGEDNTSYTFRLANGEERRYHKDSVRSIAHDNQPKPQGGNKK